MKKHNDEEVLLRVENLCQYFKMGDGELRAVDGVSFDIKRGEVFGLVGESGCGKTTTGRSIIKLYEITDGNIYFDGIRIAAGIRSYKERIKEAKKEYKRRVKSADAATRAKLKTELNETVYECQAAIKSARDDSENCDRRYAGELASKVRSEYLPKIESKEGEEREKLLCEYKSALRSAKRARPLSRIQMVFQDPIASLNPRMTVREIISEGLVVQGERDKNEINRRVYEMLELVGLVKEHAGRYPHEFSGGQRQRIGIARSIIMNPELIIADEPVSALDVSIQAQVINLLGDLRDKFGLTILFIAHDLSVVKYFSDRIGVMYFGKIVELADSDELFRHPLHPYTRSLLSAIPMPDPVYEKKRQRIVYNYLEEHDYSADQPSMREVAPGHLVYCNGEEFRKYTKMLKEDDSMTAEGEKRELRDSER